MLKTAHRKVSGFFVYHEFLSIAGSGNIRNVLESMDISVSGNTANSSSEQLITDIEAKMDSLNSFSQQTMIDLQSLTSKRDQSYDMISNIIKSLYTTLTTNSNNL